MVRSRRSVSKEDAVSLLTDSGISLSSPPAAGNPHQALRLRSKGGRAAWQVCAMLVWTRRRTTAESRTQRMMITCNRSLRSLPERANR